METVPGLAVYRLPEGFGRFRMVALRMGENYLELTQILPAEMDATRNMSNEPLTGVPAYYAVTDRMELWPSPSGVWEIARTWECIDAVGNR